MPKNLFEGWFDKPPRRSGNVYCSPWCGGQCKWTAFVSARQKATDLAKRLNKKFGSGWTPRVWENLGWNYEVKNNAVAVCPCSGDGRQYRATACLPMPYLAEVCFGTTPEAAMKGLTKS